MYVFPEPPHPELSINGTEFKGERRENNSIIVEDNQPVTIKCDVVEGFRPTTRISVTCAGLPIQSEFVVFNRTLPTTKCTCTAVQRGCFKRRTTVTVKVACK